MPTYTNINGQNTGSIIPTTPPAPITPPAPTPAQNPVTTPSPTVLHNPDGSVYTPPASTTSPTGKDVFGNPVATPQSAQTSTPASTTAQSAVSLSDQADRTALQNEQAAYQAQNQFVQTQIQNIQNGTTPLTPGEQAQIDGLKAQFQTLIDAQQLTNTGATGTAQIRGYQTGAGEYDPKFQAQTIGSIVSAGQQKIADLNTKMAMAVAQLTQSFKDNDIKAVQNAWSLYSDASKQRQDALQKTIDDTTAAIKDAQAAAEKSKQDFYNQVTKPIQDIALTAAKNGASQDVLAALGNAKTVSDALALAGPVMQTSTNPDIAQYLFYKQQAEASGTTPQSFEEYQKAKGAAEAQQAYAKAYATAKGSAAGSASAAPVQDIPVSGGLGGDGKGGSILAQTGLSIGAFNFLTQGTASMSRMGAAQRNAIMNEAQNYLNRTGTDISTFQSQYKAYNDVLQRNISRANQTKIMAGEVTASADALIGAIDENGKTKSGFSVLGVLTPFGGLSSEGMSSIRAVNILDLMAGKQTNNKFAQTYSTQLRFMANDLAGYLAAARGATSPELQDQRDAAEVISSGMNKGSTEAFRAAVIANEEKVVGVVNNAVTSTQKQVWGLFGVADKYASPTNTGDMLTQQTQQDAQKVDAYIQSNPGQFESVSKLYNNGFTDQQVAEYLNL